MSSVKVSIDTSKFRERYTKYVSEIRNSLESEWPAVTQACLHDVASRAPDPETELAYIQGYSGGTREGVTPTKSHQEDRISFIREPGQWLQTLVLDPTTYITNSSELKMNLGLVEALETGSAFSWQNYSNKLGPIVHTSLEGPSTYGVWSFFEYGHMATQTAKYPPGPGKNGAPAHYKLKDGEASFWSSTKTYPRMGMYSYFSTDVFRTAIREVTNKVKF